jgi:hypothetical protein
MDAPTHVDTVVKQLRFSKLELIVLVQPALGNQVRDKLAPSDEPGDLFERSFQSSNVPKNHRNCLYNEEMLASWRYSRFDAVEHGFHGFGIEDLLDLALSPADDVSQLPNFPNLRAEPTHLLSSPTIDMVGDIL